MYNKMHNTQTVLVVEDDASIGEVITDFLNDEGYQIKVCSTGRTALVELNRNNYAVVLLDMQLPDMTGNDVLLQMSKQAIKTPVIAVSADTTYLEYRERVQAIVNKPFDLLELLDTIEQVILQTKS
jgi:DNA-binding response OmpR family regulator